MLLSKLHPHPSLAPRSALAGTAWAFAGHAGHGPQACPLTPLPGEGDKQLRPLCKFG